jgi:hypothetical protein
LRSHRWFASLAATAGLAGSALLGSSAAPASAQTPAAAAAAVSRVLPSQGAATHTDGKGGPQDSGSLPAPKSCLGLVPSPYPYANTTFVCNDWRFGPRSLPHTGVIGSILSGYHRFGQLTPVEFLNKWWNPSPPTDPNRGDWRYPPDDGFGHNASGGVIAGLVTLHPGQLVDRFGNEFGRFLAPAGAKFAGRALPPSSLNTEDPRYPFNYHLYRVKKDTNVCSGPQAPAFEQPGQGVQYVTNSTFCPRLPTNVNVASLVNSGNLERAN